MHDKGRCRRGVAPEAIVMCWPVTPRRVAGLDGGDTVTHRPSHAQPYGDCAVGLWSLGRPAADGGDFELSAPLITGLTPLPYPKWTGRECLAANMCECKDTEADQRQVKLLEGSGHLGPRRKRKALWGWLVLHESVSSLGTALCHWPEHI